MRTRRERKTKYLDATKIKNSLNIPRSLKMKKRKGGAKRTRDAKRTKSDASKYNNTKSNRVPKKHNKTIKLEKVNCSPKDKHEINEFSCYTNKSLYKLRGLWNDRHPDAKIMTNSAKEIHRQISEKLSGTCNKESCWIKQYGDFGKIKKEMIDETFAPVSPKEWKKNPNEWLSSVDIMDVMKQYERAYKCFDFIGPSPIDFDTRMLYGECVWDELCNFSLKDQLKRNKTKIGVIFNTDPHDKGGQHWISLFINIKKGQILFFDSTGDDMPPQVRVLINRIKEQGMQLEDKINFKIDDTKGVEHQRGNTECGIYSLYFIIHMLKDKTSDHYLKTHIISDDAVNKFRKIYFNESL